MKLITMTIVSLMQIGTDFDKVILDLVQFFGLIKMGPIFDWFRTDLFLGVL